MKLPSPPQERTSERINFHSINRAALSALPAILARLLPGGKIIAGEYVVKNPLRSDRHAGSFKISLRTGRWADFAADGRGGDVASLIAYVENKTQYEAARLLAGMLGLGGRGDE